MNKLIVEVTKKDYIKLVHLLMSSGNFNVTMLNVEHAISGTTGNVTKFITLATPLTESEFDKMMHKYAKDIEWIGVVEEVYA